MPGLDKNKWLFVLAVVATIAASWVVFRGYLDSPFIYDDIHTIRDNPSIKTTLNPVYYFQNPESASRFNGAMTRPLLTWTYALDWQRSGGKPSAFRATNLVIHSINALLVLFLTMKTRSLKSLAPLAALLFLVHPLQSIQVGYVTCRSTLLSSTFYLAGLILFASLWNEDEDSRGPFGSATIKAASISVLFLAGLFVKASISTLPAAIILWAFIFNKENGAGDKVSSFRGLVSGQGGKKLAAVLAVLTLAFLVYLVYRRVHSAPTLFPPQRPWTVGHYLAMQVGAFWTYAKLLVLPVNPSIEHEAPGAAGAFTFLWLLKPIGIAALVAISFSVRRISKESSFALLFSMLYLAPTSTVVPLVVPINENRIYLSVLAVAWPAAAMVNGLAGKKKTLSMALALTVVVLYSVLTVSRAADYSSGLALWRDAMSKAPASSAVQVNLGMEYAAFGRLAEAEACYKRALEIDPASAEALNNLGNLSYKKGDWDKAMDYYRRALAASPGSLSPAINLADLLVESGEAGRSGGGEAVRVLESALAYDPDNPEVLGRLGLVHARGPGDRKRAAEYLDKAIEKSVTTEQKMKWESERARIR